MVKNEGSSKIRYYWVDNTKLFACFLVALFHFLPTVYMPLALHTALIITYTFHVPLFFVCSGFLYQKSDKVHSLSSWKDNVISKLIALGVPYFAFSLITILFKTIFSDDVTTKLSNSILNILFLNPISPYWYLYILFFLFLIIPCMKTKKQAAVLFIICLTFKILDVLNVDFIHIKLPYIIDTIFGRSIWFALGMLLAFDVIDFKKLYMKIIMPIAFVVTIIPSAIYFTKGGNAEWVSFVTGAVLVTFFLFLFENVRIQKFDSLCQKLSPLFMPIFVMHTIFAAGIRIIMLKLGITSTVIHLIAGFTASFLCPVIYYLIAKKSKIFMFLIYPERVLKNKGNI